MRRSGSIETKERDKQRGRDVRDVTNHRAPELRSLHRIRNVPCSLLRGSLATITCCFGIEAPNELSDATQTVEVYSTLMKHNGYPATTFIIHLELDGGRHT